MSEAKELLLTTSIILLFLLYLYRCLRSRRGSSLGVDFCVCCLFFAIFGGYSPVLLAEGMDEVAQCS